MTNKEIYLIEMLKLWYFWCHLFSPISFASLVHTSFSFSPLLFCFSNFFSLVKFFVEFMTIDYK